jgi:hypothetical protein
LPLGVALTSALSVINRHRETLGDARGRGGGLAGGCLRLPAGAPGDGYVLAIQQSSRAEVLVLADQVRREPTFVGSVHQLCTD